MALDTPRVEVTEVLPHGTPAPASPRIAVLAPLNLSNATPHVADLIRRFARTAMQTLIDVGADPHLVDLTAPSLPPLETVSSCDGVLLLGGGDMDPSLYGHLDPVPNEYGVDRAVDDYSIEAVVGSIASATPLLGICRGHQVLNVALGGDLIPDLDDHTVHHGAGEDLMLDETVRIDPSSELGRIVNARKLVVRTGHHQAIRTVAPGLRAVAWAADGVVEGVEHDAHWAVGVQWHPEDPDGSAADREQLFGAFVKQAREPA